MNLWKNRNWTPMLLGQINKPFDDSKYLFEIKYDGIRAILFVSKKNTTIITRSGHNITHLYPELIIIKDLVKENTIFDGEIVAMDKGIPSFLKLQERMHLKSKSKIAYLSKNDPVVFIAFDILYQNKNLIKKKLIDRKKILDNYPDTEVFIKSKWLIKEGKKLFSSIKKLKMEGTVAKELNSTYDYSNRSSSWLKIKNYKDDYFFIGGYTEKEKNYVISLLLGEYKNNKLYFVGKVSLSKKRKLYKEIKKLPLLLQSPFWDYNEKNIIYLKPTLSCKIHYIEKTNNNHLRQPFIP